MAETQKYGFMSLDEIKMAVILDRVASHGGNKSEAARTLGIARHTIDNLLARYEKQDLDARGRVDMAKTKVKEMMKLQGTGYEFDVDSGMSKPVPPAPMPGAGVVLMKPKPQPETPALVAPKPTISIIKPVPAAPAAPVADKTFNDQAKKAAGDLKKPAGDQKPLSEKMKLKDVNKKKLAATKTK